MSKDIIVVLLPSWLMGANASFLYSVGGSSQAHLDGKQYAVLK